MSKVKGHILLVEDDPMTQIIMERFLSKRNYAVDIVDRGEDALKLLERGNYRAAIVDIQLPDMDGLQVIQSMRKHNKRLPLIAHSGFDDYFTQQTALQVGAQVFFVKPASLVSLANWIKRNTHPFNGWHEYKQLHTENNRLRLKSY